MCSELTTCQKTGFKHVAKRKYACLNSPYNHCEILGSYLQQHRQHPIFRAHFHAEPQGRAQTKKVDELSIPNSESEFTASGLTDITASLCRAM